MSYWVPPAVFSNDFLGGKVPDSDPKLRPGDIIPGVSEHFFFAISIIPAAALAVIGFLVLFLLVRKYPSLNRRVGVAVVLITSIGIGGIVGFLGADAKNSSFAVNEAQGKIDTSLTHWADKNYGIRLNAAARDQLEYNAGLKEVPWNAPDSQQSQAAIVNYKGAPTSVNLVKVTGTKSYILLDAGKHALATVNNE